MKRLIFAIGILCLLSASMPCAADTNAGILGQGASVAGDTYEDLLFFYRCEDLTLAADDYYGSGDSEGTISGTTEAACIIPEAAQVGTNGCAFITTTDAIAFDSANLIDYSAGRIGFWFEPTTSSSAISAEIFQAMAGTTDWMLLQSVNGTTGTGDIDLRFSWKDNNTYRTALTADTNLSLGTVYFLEFAWEVATDYREIFVDGTSVGSTSADINAFGTTPTVFKISSGGAPSYWYIDNFMISNSTTRSLYALRNLTSAPR